MIIAYTCNIGHYDLYRNIFPKDDTIKYIYFTDDGVPVNGWQVLPVDIDITDNPRKLARYYKINSHLVLPEHDMSLWMDARFILKEGAVEKFVREYKDNDISCFEYPYQRRFCAYDEADICAKNHPYNKDVIKKQTLRYEKEGFPRDFGLFATGIMIRKNNKKVAKFNETWWNEIKNGSERDQISQTYSSWKSGVEISKINNHRNVYSNDIVTVYNHRVNRKEDNKSYLSNEL